MAIDMSWCKNRTIFPQISSRIEKAVAVTLRVPALFLLDYSCQWAVGRHAPQCGLLVSNLALLNGFVLLLLPLTHLKRYYLHVLCWTILSMSLCLSYTLLLNLDSGQVFHFESLRFSLNNQHVVSLLVSIGGRSTHLYFPFFVLHTLFDAINFVFLQTSSRFIILRLLCYSILATSYMLHVSQNVLQIMNYVSYMIFYASFLTYSCQYIPRLYSEAKAVGESALLVGQNNGLAFLCLEVLQKVFVPVYFLIFWLVTFCGRLYLQLAEANWYYLLLSVTSSIYTSPVSLLSTSIMVTYVSCFLLSSIKLYLWGNDRNVTHNLVNINANRDHNGWEEGMTTLLLTSLTALTDMSESARMAVLLIIAFVVLSSLLQSMLEISEPAILSLNIHYSHNRLHHLKVLLLCAFLFYLPLHVTYLISRVFPFNFWIAVVFSTSLLISARVIDLVVIHCLFWWDSCQSEPWDALDEIVYFVRAITKVAELAISVSVVVVGVWEALDSRFNLLNSAILILHCYFNVWQRVQEGLGSFLQRREANRLAQSLESANPERISQCADLCSICYLEMKETQSSVVVITHCNHLFHRVCIKKWLCIQNFCPLCTAIVNQKEE